MNYSITKNGKPLDKKLYTIDEKTKTFSSNESGLVLDFSDEYGWVFNTNSDCTFKTDSDCTFDTSYDCTFNTGYDCTFKTGFDCVVVRRDIFEVIKLKEGKKIKLNGYNIKGYKVLVKKATKDTTTKEMTVAEVSEKLGYDIKIIK